MLRRMAQAAQLPGHSEHLQRMRGVNAAEATRAAASNLSGDDQMLLPLFDAIKGFAEADDSAEPVPLPSGLTGFQRAMVRVRVRVTVTVTVRIRVRVSVRVRVRVRVALRPHRLPARHGKG